jgi:hypothetical protein
MGVGGQRHAPKPHYPLGKHSVPIVQEVGWVPGPIWKGVEKLVPTGIRSPDRPAHLCLMLYLRTFVQEQQIAKLHREEFWISGQSLHIAVMGDGYAQGCTNFGRQVPVAATIFVGAQYGTCFMSPIWRLEF